MDIFTTATVESPKVRQTPKVTVLMSVYNGERFLRRAIESILAQTYQDIEFLIIDDASTDRSREIISSYKDSRLRLIDNEKNIGLTRSLNKGLRLAKGEYVARMDADDISLPKRLEMQVRFLDSHPSIGLLGINSWMIDEDGEVLSRLNSPTSHSEIMAKMLLENRFVHSSVMLRKNLLDTHGYYNEDLNLAQDYELFLRLSIVTELANLAEPLHVWRKNYSTGISLTRRPEQLAIRDATRKAFLEKRVTLNKDYANILLENFKNNPKDIILSEYLVKMSKAIPLFSKLFIMKLKIFYYLWRYRNV